MINYDDGVPVNANFEAAQRYLPDRGILPETWAAAQVEINEGASSATIIFPVLLTDTDGSIHSKSSITRQFPDNGRKFMCTQGEGYRPYILPGAPVRDTGVPVVVTEGPTRVLLLHQNGFAAIGANGCYGPMQPRTDEEKEQHAPIKLHADLDPWSWNGRQVFLAPDMDFTRNEDVLRGIVRQITAFAAAGAETQVVCWDPAQGKGLDDFVVREAGLDLPAQTGALNRLIEHSVAGTDFLRRAHIDLVVAEFNAADMSPAKKKQLARVWAKTLGVGADVIARTEEAADKKNILIQDIDPWPDPVDGAKLLSDICATIRTYVSLTDDETVTIALGDADLFRRARRYPPAPGYHVTRQAVRQSYLDAGADPIGAAVLSGGQCDGGLSVSADRGLAPDVFTRRGRHLFPTTGPRITGNLYWRLPNSPAEAGMSERSRWRVIQVWPPRPVSSPTCLRS